MDSSYSTEMRAYMGFMILMGIVRLLSLCDYWKNDCIFHYSPIADLISQHRFLDIHRYLHFANKESLHEPSSPDYDKLGTVRPILTALAEQFKKSMNLERI